MSNALFAQQRLNSGIRDVFNLITDEQDILRIPAFRTATW